MASHTVGLRLLEFLLGDSDSCADHRGRVFQLEGPPVPVDRLPKVCCDYDTIVYYLLYNLSADRGSFAIDGDDRFRPPWRIRERSRYWYGHETLRERADLMRSRHHARWSGPSRSRSRWSRRSRRSRPTS